MPNPNLLASPETTLDIAVRQLCAISPQAFTPDVVKATLGNARIAEASLTPYLHWRKLCYTRNLVFRNETFELIVLCWEPGSVSSIHNHAGQECWLSVQQGALCIESFDLVEPSHCNCTGDDVRVRLRERSPKLEAGMVDHRGPHNDLHRVINRRAFGARAVSVHVYSKPIDECIIYDSIRGGAQKKCLSYDSVDNVLCNPIPML